ncbi:DMT family transporter [Inhella proteolytica]|uniref:DMT family transporter n=1 Tax=Inhella proteolytica TaxID=2795029 RepID=A0A931NIQ0_9BURK|nr:DMT family transporter [Inhella proteolytica]MBH9578254.1 DMT family transporter [Inhella proteolytica]
MHTTTLPRPAALLPVGLLAALATVLFWASSFPLIRAAVAEFSPLPLAALRYAVAGLAMGAWLLLAPGTSAQRPLPREWPRLLLAAGLGIVAYNLLLNSGQRTVSAGAASFIANTAPAMTALLAVLLLGERLRAWAWPGMGLSLAGVGLIAGAQPGGLHLGAGALQILGSAACLALFFVVQRPLLARLGGLRTAAWVIVLGGLLLLPWLPTGLAQAQLASMQGIWTVIALGLFPAALGYGCWAVAQAHYGAARAASFLYLVPPTATVMALVLLGERPSPQVLLGGALALGGVLVVNRWGKA